MILKFIGLLLVFTAFAGTGLYSAYRWEQRPRELKALIIGLNIMLGEITYGLHRLPLALKRAGEGTSNLSASRASSLFRLTSEYMSSSLGLTASEAWASSLGIYSGSRELSERDLIILKSFGDSLGNGGLSEQIKHINLALDSLKREIDTADEDSRRMGKVNRSVWMAAGACVVLLLI